MNKTIQQKNSLGYHVGVINPKKMRNNLGYKEMANKILHDDILKHKSGHCECSVSKGRTYFCKTKEWMKGIISDKQIVEDNYYNKP